MKAEEKGMDLQNYLDLMAKEHREVWDFFNFSYTDFIRTTEKRHHLSVQDALQHCFDK
jgi:methionyl-tRNA synthetase